MEFVSGLVRGCLQLGILYCMVYNLERKNSSVSHYDIVHIYHNVLKPTRVCPVTVNTHFQVAYNC